MAKSSIERLRFCNFKLRTLLNITQAINRNAPIDELLNSFKHLLSTELNIGRFILFSNLEKKWSLWLDYGVDYKDYEHIDIENDLLSIKDIEITIGESDNKFVGFDFIIPIFKNDEVIAYVLIGDVDNEQIGLSPSIQHLQFIQTLTNIIMVAIQNKELVKQSVAQERVKKELETASKIQATLLPAPEELPQSKIFKIKPFYMSHYEVGGDLYDYGVISPNEIYFCIADVSGKGISAALIMANFQANLRAQFRNKQNVSFIRIVKSLNENILKVSKGNHFVTMFLAKFNTNTRKLTYVNAGHLPPMLYDYDTKELTSLKTGSVGIGMLDEIPKIRIGKLKIPNKAKILCFTDGLSEYSTDGQKDYGYFVAKEAMKHSDKNIEDTIDFIINKLSLNKENKKIFDDITMLGIEIKSCETNNPPEVSASLSSKKQ